jgi:NB-ARC domain
LQLVRRFTLATACAVVALGIDVLINMVASGKWSWQASAGLVAGAAVAGTTADAIRRRAWRQHQQLRAATLSSLPGDDQLIPRPSEKSQVIEVLKRNHWRAKLILLEGEGGYGKSTLARSVCDDPVISKKYSGVYWIRCGEDAVSDYAIAGLVNDFMHRYGLVRDRPADTDPETVGQHLGQVLEQLGRVLLFVDDVWTYRQLQPFLTGAKRCTRLVTTRTPELPLPAAARVRVGPMSASQSKDLLMRGLPPSPANQPDMALLDQVISRTGRWPLILSLLNKVLAERMRAGYSPDEALEEIAGHLDVQGPRGADELDVRLGPQGRSTLVQTTLSAGLALVNAPDARERLLDLGVFAPRAIVPVKLVSRMWGSISPRTDAEAASLCSRMANLSFFAITDGHVQLHDVMHEFLRHQSSGEDLANLSGLLVDVLSQGLTVSTSSGHDGDALRIAWWEGGAFPAYTSEHVVRHLMEAGRQREAAALACDLRWVLYRLRSGGTTSVLADLATAATDRARELSDAVKRVAHILSEAETRQDAGQTLLNALRTEPGWAEQAAAVQNEPDEPMLVSNWPLPDNPGPALRHVYKIPSPPGRDDAVALSRDGSWLAIAGDGRVFAVDTSTGKITATHTVDRQPGGSIGRIANQIELVERGS